MAGRFRRLVTAHLQTWRPYTLAYPGLVALAGALCPPGRPRPAQLVLVAGVAAASWVGAHYLSDVADRHLDAASKPQRPIPSGRLSPVAATVTGSALILAAIVTVVVVNWRVAWLAAAGLACALGYGTVFKARGMPGNLVRGAATALALLSAAMITHRYPPLAAVVLAAAFLCHDAASNLVGTLRDVDGDRAGGFRTVAVTHGVRRAARWAWRLYLTAIALCLIAGWPLDRADRWAYLTFVAVAVALGGTAFGRVLRPAAGPDRHEALSAHKLLVIERLVLASAMIAAGVGIPIALALLLPLIAVSTLTQTWLRNRYEFGDPLAPPDLLASPDLPTSPEANERT